MRRYAASDSGGQKNACAAQAACRLLIFGLKQVFILVESTIDHQGNKKKNFFEIENFNKFKDKIIHLRIEDFPRELSSTWERENFQRNYISKSINNLLDDDYIIISDIDEIPNFDNLKISKSVNLPLSNNQIFVTNLI